MNTTLAQGIAELIRENDYVFIGIDHPLVEFQYTISDAAFSVYEELRSNILDLIDNGLEAIAVYADENLEAKVNSLSGYESAAEIDALAEELNCSNLALKFMKLARELSLAVTFLKTELANYESSDSAEFNMRSLEASRKLRESGLKTLVICARTDLSLVPIHVPPAEQEFIPLLSRTRDEKTKNTASIRLGTVEMGSDAQLLPNEYPLSAGLDPFELNSDFVITTAKEENSGQR